MTKPETKLEGGEITPDEPFYIRKTDEDIRDIAQGVREGRIFGSWMIRPEDAFLTPNIFFGLVYMDEIVRTAYRFANVMNFFGVIGRDTSDAKIKDYPMFYRFYTLDQIDTDRLAVMLDEKMNAPDW